MTTFYVDVAKASHASAGDERVQFGAVTTAVMVLDTHIQDPAARVAWETLCKSVLSPWVKKGLEHILKPDAVKTEFRPKSESDPNDRRRVVSLSLGQSPDIVKIGRLKTSHVVFDDPSVARMHAVLERNGSEWIVVDLGANGGIRVNGERVHRNAHILPGDILTIGDCTVELTR